MSKAVFYDPAAAETYTFLINYEEMSGPSRPSQVNYDSRSSGLGSIPTQGDYQPLILTLTGKCLHRTQYVKFWHFHQMKNSFRFTDEEGQQYEVSMTGLETSKVHVSYNPFDPGMRLHYYTYTMTLQVLTVISGDLSGVTP